MPRRKRHTALNDAGPEDGPPDWLPPKTPFSAPRQNLEGEHSWELQGHRFEANTTVYRWRCPECRSTVDTTSPGADPDFYRDESTPSANDLKKARVDPDCRQALVDGVHDT